MIRLHGVTYTYQGAPRPALQEIDLTVHEGEWVLLAGPSGSGKSSLLHLINGLVPHVLGGELRGEVRVDGLVPGQVPIREISRRVGTVFQNPELQLFMLRVEEDVAFGCENLGLPPEETRQRVEWALGRLSLATLRRQEVFTLSGGQKQRLAIAGALAMGTKILLLDEPTSDLDRGSRAELLAALRGLHEQGHTILMTEHRFDALEGLVDRVLFMDAGRIISSGSLIAACRLPRRNELPRSQDGEVLVEAEGIEFAYTDRQPVLREAAFRLRAGEVVALTGLNGSGKTTLLKMLCGLLRPRKGRLCIAGIQQPTLRDLVGRVGFLFQNPDEQILTDCVTDEILFGPRNLGARSTSATTSADSPGSIPRCASSQPLAGRTSAPRRRSGAGDAAAGPAPGRADDWPGSSGVVQSDGTARRRGESSGACVLFSTHHREAAEAFAERTLDISQGRLVDDRLP